MTHGCVGGHEFAAMLPTNIPEGVTLAPERFTCACGTTSMTVTSQHNPGPAPIEGVVVASRAHTMTFAGTCLDCGQDARQGHCTPTAGLGVPFGLPRMVVAGEVDPGDSRDN